MLTITLHSYHISPTASAESGIEAPPATAQIKATSFRIYITTTANVGCGIEIVTATAQIQATHFPT